MLDFGAMREGVMWLNEWAQSAVEEVLRYATHLSL